MTQQTQSIDISPEKVAPIARAGVQLLNLSSTLVPGNLRAQVGVLEVYLSGLAGGQLVLAPAPKPVVESDDNTLVRQKNDGARQLEAETNDKRSPEGSDSPTQGD